MFNHSPMSLPIDQQQRLGLAVQYHQGGHLSEAETLYRQILNFNPRHPETLHRFASLLMQIGKTDSALPLLEQAKQIEPGYPGHWLLLTQCLLDLNRSKEAKKVILEAIRKGLSHPKAEELLRQAKSGGVKSAERLGQPPKEEIAALERLLGTGGYVEAETRANSFVQRHPKNDRAWYILAMARMTRGQYQTAIEALQRSLKLKPNFPESYFNLGYSYERLGLFDKALGAYAEAFKLKPNFPEAYHALFVLFIKLGRYNEGLKVCNRILEFEPNHFSALNNKALILRKSGQQAEAIEIYRRLVPQGNKFAEFHFNYGNALLDLGLSSEALAEYRLALDIDPDHLDARGGVILVSNYMGETKPEMLLLEARAYGETLARKAMPCTSHNNKRDPDRCLRVGLVSGDLGDHSVGYFLEGVLKNIDPAKLELFAYSTANHPEDALNRRLHDYVQHWCEATADHLSDEALVKKIQEDGIDILVDLSGHTAYNRLPVFAQKPAPVQVTWLGYLGTTGVKTIDYLLADLWSLPPEEENQFTETIWRLPETYICFSPPDVHIEVGTLPALSNGFVTFGCFNNVSKITDRVLSCWARIMHAVPESLLFLKARALDVEEVRESLIERFAGHGIEPNRLILKGRLMDRKEHFQAYQKIDIALDPFPYPGITTTVEALWMGVPSVVLKGDRFLSHQGETIMHNAGLSDWIAKNEADYVERAISFTKDIGNLSTLRAGLRSQVLASPLFDSNRFARNLEIAFRGMWRKWCERKSD